MVHLYVVVSFYIGMSILCLIMYLNSDPIFNGYNCYYITLSSGLLDSKNK